MNNPKDLSLIETYYVNDFTLFLRFKYQRAILNAITQAKITDGTYKPQKIICRLPAKTDGNGWLNTWWNQKAN